MLLLTNFLSPFSVFFSENRITSHYYCFLQLSLKINHTKSPIASQMDNLDFFFWFLTTFVYFVFGGWRGGGRVLISYGFSNIYSSNLHSLLLILNIYQFPLWVRVLWMISIAMAVINCVSFSKFTQIWKVTCGKWKTDTSQTQKYVAPPIPLEHGRISAGCHLVVDVQYFTLQLVAIWTL